MFGPKIVETVESKYSGKIVVKKDLSGVYVTTGGLTQSGGELIKEVWNAFLKKHWPWQLRRKRWLILGLATGTVAKMISENYHPLEIVGVEIDPVMLSLGRKYFGLDQIPNLRIVNQDAKLYVSKCPLKFDFVLVDMYLGDVLPGFVYTKTFIQKIRELTLGTAVFNHLAFDDQKREKTQRLIAVVSSIFSQVKLRRVLTNILVVCQ